MMKKFALLALLAAGLAVPSIASAAVSQGTLTGAATLTRAGSSFNFSTGTPVIDGGTTFVGLENDKSGNCNGDSGQVLVSFAPPQVLTFTVLCAHYVASSRDNGSPKMRLAYQVDTNVFQVVRIIDNGGSLDTWAGGATDTLAHARAWVNKGAIGGVGGLWTFATITSGGFTVCGVCV